MSYDKKDEILNWETSSAEEIIAHIKAARTENNRFIDLNPPKRILYAIMAYGPHIIASEVHSELGKAFRERGHSFSVASPNDYAEAGEAGAKAFPAETGTVEVFNIQFKNSFWRRIIRRICRRLFHYAFFLDLYWGYKQFLRQHKNDFDVLHVEAAYPLGAAIALANRKLKIPFIVTLQGADVMDVPAYDYGYGRFWLPRRLLRYTFKRATGVRANSEQTAKIALELGADAAKVKSILRNVILPADEKAADFKAQSAAMLRQKYNLNEGAILIAFSRLHPFKGLDFLVKAVPLLQEKLGKVNLLICGPSRKTPQFGDYRQYLERLVQQQGVSDSVAFTGKVDFSQSQNYLAGADLLIVPSVVEALNKVVIEAAAVGTPSVITETTGIATHAVSAGVAVSVKPAKPQSLAEGIVTALGQKEQLGARGADFAANFSAEKIADELLEFYQARLAFRPHRGGKESLSQPDLSEKTAESNPRIAYVAYPSSLNLKSANAIQTFTTCRELKKLAPDTLILIPRLPFRASAFSQIGATHLWRLPFNFFNNIKLLKGFPWTYAERAWFSHLAGFYLLCHKLNGNPTKVIYVRDVICAYFLIKYWRKLSGAKVVYEVHDLEQRNPSRAKSKLWRKWLEKVDHTVIGKADGVVSLTQAFLDFAKAEKLLPNLPTAVIPDAFDDTVYRPLAMPTCRQPLEIAPDEFVVVYSGMTFAYRNLDKLVEAFAAFCQKHPTAKAALYLVGGRDFERAEMQRVAAKFNLGDKVKCVGQVGAEKVNLYLNAANALAIPDTVTDITASPLKMFEYAAVGKPILLPDIASLKEILSEAEAVYFERGSVPAMTEAIEEIFSNSEQATKKGARALAKVQSYTYRNRAKAILKIAEF
jgi:glycosyltransferase involved in cell wall biosynthesis